jgi:hypothetical protein
MRPFRVLLLATALVMLASSTATAVPYVGTTPEVVSPVDSSPFAPCEAAVTEDGIVYVSGEVEPHAAVDPDDEDFLVGGWQQDRWSDGGASGNSSAVSTDGGDTWTVIEDTKHSICSGGTAANGGDYERATDPWLAVSPDGTAYFQSLSFNNTRDLANAVLVSRLEDGAWSDPVTLIRDTDNNVFNDKNSMTADYNDSDLVYAVWDRLVFPVERAGGRSWERAAAYKGPIYFTRTTDGGETWEEARSLFDPGRNSQTIGNQIAVLPRDEGDTESTLVNVFNLISTRNKEGLKGYNVAIIRSEDSGETWSEPIIVDKLGTAEISDPDTGEYVRTADIIPMITVDRSSGALYAVWQDARFTDGNYDQIAMSVSVDAGLTWSEPVRVNQTPEPDADEPAGNVQAFTPQVQVLDDGTVGVLYYDFRNNDAGDAALETDAFLVHCDEPSPTDDDLCAGEWEETRITPTSFDHRQAPDAGGLFLGDYIGLVDTDADGDGVSDTFVPFFTQSNDESDPSTIYSSLVSPQP